MNWVLSYRAPGDTPPHLSAAICPDALPRRILACESFVREVAAPLTSRATLGFLAPRCVFGFTLQRPPSDAGLPRDTFSRPAASGHRGWQIYTYIYIYIHTYIHTYTYIYIYMIYTSRSLALSLSIYIYIYIYICVHVHIPIYIYIHKCVCIYIYIYIHICIYTHMLSLSWKRPGVFFFYGFHRRDSRGPVAAGNH